MASNMYTENRKERKRLPIPGDLNEFQGQVWVRVTFCVPPQHFNVTHIDMLRRYVLVAEQLFLHQKWEQKLVDAEGIDGLFYTSRDGVIRKNLWRSRPGN